MLKAGRTREPRLPGGATGSRGPHRGAHTGAPRAQALADSRPSHVRRATRAPRGAPSCRTARTIYPVLQVHYFLGQRAPREEEPYAQRRPVSGCPPPLSVVPPGTPSSQPVPTTTNHSTRPPRSRPWKFEILLMPRRRRGDSPPILTPGGGRKISPNQEKKKKKENPLPSAEVLFLKVPAFPDLTFEQFTFV